MFHSQYLHLPLLMIRYSPDQRALPLRDVPFLFLLVFQLQYLQYFF